MDISLNSSSATGRAYAVQVTNKVRDQQKVEGQAAVDLIEQSGPAPVGPDGVGAHVDVHA